MRNGSGMGIKHLGRSLAGLAFAIAFAGCIIGGGEGGTGGRGNGATSVRESWDTSFSIDGTVFSDSSLAVGRAIVRQGDARRMDGFLRKCISGGEVRIGFLGGSITGGAAASRPGNRYSSRFCAFLGRLFPQTRFTEINAGIGATNSRYGCSRAQSDLLSHAPDLMVLEFAVNDDWNDSALFMSTMEGLIRKCLSSTNAPVLLYHAMNRNGNSVNQDYQERLGAYYDLPVVSFLKGLLPAIESGGLRVDSLLSDAVHPNDRGHLAGAYMLFRCVARAHAAWNGGGGSPAKPPFPLLSDFYQRSGLMEAGDSTISVAGSTGWIRSLDPLGRDAFASVSAGAFLELDCTARELSVGYRKRKGLNATVEITVDGAVTDTLSNGFPEDWGGGYTRFDLAYCAPSTHAVHRIGFRVLTGDSMTIEAVLYGGK
ncbi:MAG: Lysophospholipase and related esterase [Fibrobacteres bacterium]|nr:Lysophospholipase and related esterase [Fibrobacterota bacterium]